MSPAKIRAILATAALALAAAAPSVAGGSGVPPYEPVAGGCGPAFEPTGFFHTAAKEGRDWVVDPLGRAVAITAIDHVRPAGWKDRNLGYDVYARFVETNYPSKEAWVDETLGRLRDWGFNTLANHCDEPLLRRRGLAHTLTLYLGGSFARAGGKDPDRWITPWSGPCTGLPNVFHPDFESEVRKAAARQCAPERDDPWLLGWFLDNELKWWGPDTARKDLTLFDAVRALPKAHTARRALEAFAAGRPVDNALREDFLRLFAERYFSVLCTAIREADPNHMILGCRFAGPFAQVHPALWEIAGRHCDIVSFNCYPWADVDRGGVLDSKDGRPIAERFGEIHGWCGRPLMVTEFAFPALDAGRPCLHGAGQRFPTQEGRAAATALFARTMLSLPYFAGYSYFMFLDQPASGISETFREDSNYGLVSESGVPYREITAAFRVPPPPSAPSTRTSPPPAPRRRRDPASADPCRTAPPSATATSPNLPMVSPVPILPILPMVSMMSMVPMPSASARKPTAPGPSPTPLSASRAAWAATAWRTGWSWREPRSAPSARSCSGAVRTATSGPRCRRCPSRRRAAPTASRRSLCAASRARPGPVRIPSSTRRPPRSH